MSRVLLLHASLGAGHKRAAQALQEALHERNISNELKDLLDFLPPVMSRFYSSSYDFMITQARFLWSAFYRMNDTPKTPYEPARSWWQKWQFTKLRVYLQEEKFTHVIATHFTPAALLTDWRADGHISGQIFSMITDNISHRCWRRKNMDRYFVSRELVAQELEAAGIEREKITVSGIPVSLVLAGPLTREEARNAWSIAADEIAVLVFTSALNLSKTTDLLKDLLRVKGKLRYLISAGKDADKEQKLKQFCANDNRFTIFGFSTRVAEMMKASDLLISKPGGLSVSEALAVGLPQILFSPIPGQEEANAEFSEQSGAAIRIQEGRGVIEAALNDLLKDPQKLPKMAVAARAAGKPQAARQVIDAVLSS